MYISWNQSTVRNSSLCGLDGRLQVGWPSRAHARAQVGWPSRAHARAQVGWPSRTEIFRQDIGLNIQTHTTSAELLACTSLL